MNTEMADTILEQIISDLSALEQKDLYYIDASEDIRLAMEDSAFFSYAQSPSIATGKFRAVMVRFNDASNSRYEIKKKTESDLDEEIKIANKRASEESDIVTKGFKKSTMELDQEQSQLLADIEHHRAYTVSKLESLKKLVVGDE